MIKHQFKYEWLTLKREKFFLILSSIFLVITLLAVRNGKEKVELREQNISLAKAEVDNYDRKASNAIDSINAGLKAVPESWLDPRSLSVYGQRGARVVAMEASPLAVLATGQSDLYTHTVKPKISAEAHTLGFSELSNPVQLMFGSFDLSFVIVYLLPLLILAFSYNILSDEKEQGIIRLTGSQPVSLYAWLISKVVFRFTLLSGVVIISIVVALLLGNVSIIDSASGVLQLLLIVVAYIFFWFLVSVVVNLRGGSSGFNAATLVGVWVVIVLMLPAFVSQFVNTFYPVPSRVNMIHEYREAQAESSKKTDQILRGYLNDHPDLAPKDSTSKNQYSYWLGHFASASVISESVQPLVKATDDAIEKQQQWVGNLRYVSPAILTQDAINDLAGTSTAHYNDFRKQVITFSMQWREHFMPRMFANESMKASDIQNLPEYKYSAANVRDVWWQDFAVVCFFGLGALGISYRLYRRSATERLMMS